MTYSEFWESYKERNSDSAVSENNDYIRAIAGLSNAEFMNLEVEEEYLDVLNQYRELLKYFSILDEGGFNPQGSIENANQAIARYIYNQIGYQIPPIDTGILNTLRLIKILPHINTGIVKKEIDSTKRLFKDDLMQIRDKYISDIDDSVVRFESKDNWSKYFKEEIEHIDKSTKPKTWHKIRLNRPSRAVNLGDIENNVKDFFVFIYYKFFWFDPEMGRLQRVSRIRWIAFGALIFSLFMPYLLLYFLDSISIDDPILFLGIKVTIALPAAIAYSSLNKDLRVEQNRLAQFKMRKVVADTLYLLQVDKNENGRFNDSDADRESLRTIYERAMKTLFELKTTGYLNKDSDYSHLSDIINLNLKK